MRNFIIIAATIIIGLCTCLHNGGSRAAGEGVPGIVFLEERGSVLADQAGLVEREEELAAELLAWDVKIEAARQEQERLRKEIPVLERSAAAAEAALAESRARRDEGVEKLGRWVNLLYRYGPVSYLEVVLEAANFNEFVERAEVIKIIIAEQVRVLGELSDLTARIQEQVSACRLAQAELSARNGELAWKLREMEKSRAGREEFLNGLRREAGDLASRVIQSETFWSGSLNSLRYFIEHLNALPWDSLAPDKLLLTDKELGFEFSDLQINEKLFNKGDGDPAGFLVRNAPGQFTISGQDVSGGAGFRMDGVLVPGPGGKVSFRPGRIYLAGLPVSREALDFIFTERELTVDFGGFLHGYDLAEIRSEEGSMAVLLKVN
ncbi:MAG: hypothetical protein A4E55_02024 [Pelotomaculum sp. PtaU1.Bin035]|nr:MAG: hypothetical protein A4E55_02024 [Pelotomaculum sp. PtaU1.Bin035]